MRSIYLVALRVLWPKYFYRQPLIKKTVRPQKYVEPKVHLNNAIVNLHTPKKSFFTILAFIFTRIRNILQCLMDVF